MEKLKRILKKTSHIMMLISGILTSVLALIEFLIIIWTGSSDFDASKVIYTSLCVFIFSLIIRMSIDNLGDFE